MQKLMHLGDVFLAFILINMGKNRNLFQGRKGQRLFRLLNLGLIVFRKSNFIELELEC